MMSRASIAPGVATKRGMAAARTCAASRRSDASRATSFIPDLRLGSVICPPLADNFLCRAVYDPANVHADAPALLMACTERLLASRTFERDSYRAGQLSGYDQPRLVDTLFLISVEYAGGAARFANGDWSDLGSFFPVIDRLVTGGGWAPAITGRYLTLCERARARYPTADFARQALAVLGPGEGSPEGWEDTFLAAHSRACSAFCRP